jgi:hypothetical protein
MRRYQLSHLQKAGYRKQRQSPAMVVAGNPKWLRSKASRLCGQAVFHGVSPASPAEVSRPAAGYSRIKTTQRYCQVSNLKVQRDYQKAITQVMQRHAL